MKVSSIKQKINNDINAYIKTKDNSDSKLEHDVKLLNKFNLVENVSDAERMALTIYSDDAVFLLSNTLLYGNAAKANKLLDGLIDKQFSDFKSEFTRDQLKNYLLKECIINTLFCVSALNKANKNEVTYTFRGEKTLFKKILQERIQASQNYLTIEQRGLLSSNIDRPSHTFNDGLAGSVAVLVAGQKGTDISAISISSSNVLNGEKELLNAPTKLSWLYKSTAAPVRFAIKDENSNDEKLFELYHNSILYSEKDKNLYFVDSSSNKIVKINDSALPEKDTLVQLIAEAKKGAVILSPDKFKQHFKDITKFEPKKHFFLAVPTTTENSIFKPNDFKPAQAPWYKISMGSLLGIAAGTALSIGLLASGILAPFGLVIIGAMLLGVVAGTTLLGTTIGLGVDLATSAEKVTPEVNSPVNQNVVSEVPEVAPGLGTLMRKSSETFSETSNHKIDPDILNENVANPNVLLNSKSSVESSAENQEEIRVQIEDTHPETSTSFKI